MGRSLIIIEKPSRDTVTCLPYEGTSYKIKPSGTKLELELEGGVKEEISGVTFKALSALRSTVKISTKNGAPELFMNLFAAFYS